MTTHVMPSSQRGQLAGVSGASEATTRYLVPLGRSLFSLPFLMSVPVAFSAQGVGYATQHGVPLAAVLVPIAGLLALLGGVSVLLGFHARLGAALLVLFLVPVTLTMHAFWSIPDPQMALMEQSNFMKNLAMLGGALLLLHFGAGPISLDARQRSA